MRAPPERPYSPLQKESRLRRDASILALANSPFPFCAFSKREASRSGEVKQR
ncbi:hypothetical protein AOX55_00003989 [Sinorhizobium fredii CCBAU 25509]|nr:hypothetical protein AOX55_00003989 [Sinorhizobium fredii CCBAU 25509]